MSTAVLAKAASTYIVSEDLNMFINEFQGDLPVLDELTEAFRPVALAMLERYLTIDVFYVIMVNSLRKAGFQRGKKGIIAKQTNIIADNFAMLHTNHRDEANKVVTIYNLMDFLVWVV